VGGREGALPRRALNWASPFQKGTPVDFHQSGYIQLSMTSQPPRLTPVDNVRKERGTVGESGGKWGGIRRAGQRSWGAEEAT